MPTMDRSTSLRIKGRNLSQGGGGARWMENIRLESGTPGQRFPSSSPLAQVGS